MHSDNPLFIFGYDVEDWIRRTLIEKYTNVQVHLRFVSKLLHRKSDNYLINAVDNRKMSKS